MAVLSRKTKSGEFVARLLPASVVVLIAACSDPSDLMQGWIGRDRSELARVWGQPSEEFTREDAGQTMIYVSYWSNSLLETYTCRRMFAADAAGTIRTASMSGC